MPTVRCNSNVLNIYLTLSGLAKGEKNYVESGLFKTPFRNSPLKKVLLCRLYRETLRRGSALDIVLNKGYTQFPFVVPDRFGYRNFTKTPVVPHRLFQRLGNLSLHRRKLN